MTMNLENVKAIIGSIELLLTNLKMELSENIPEESTEEVCASPFIDEYDEVFLS